VPEPFSIALGVDSGSRLQLGLPVLGGPACENLFPAAKPVGRAGSLRLNEQADWLLGSAVVPIRDDLEAVTESLYCNLFSALGECRLVRCWNYVPEINADGPGQLENYRIFCRGRAHAFEERYGAGFASVLPAASAVGAPAGALALIFAATRGEVRHLENPLQMPAYEYPQAYGPRPPSFARATATADASGQCVFISGTAAIRGHATVAPDRTTEQLEFTIQNLAEISKICGLGSDLGRGRARRRHFKVYLRHAHEYAETVRFLDRALVDAADSVTYLQAEICRRDLNVEIEATIMLR
jgi:hypothetical protein